MARTAPGHLRTSRGQCSPAQQPSLVAPPVAGGAPRPQGISLPLPSLLHPASGLLPWTSTKQVDSCLEKPNMFTKKTASVFKNYAWRIPGTEEPGGLPSMRSHRVGHD